MATRRQQQRERLREQRHQDESQQADAHARKRRVQYLVIAAFAAVAVVVALILISQSGGGSSTSPPANVQGVAQVNAELNGIKQSGQVLGDPSAPVTVTEFGDPQCPVCAAFSQQIAPELISSDVKSGSVKYEFQPFLIIGPDSKPAMKAALAAGEQGRFWNYLQLFYRNQGGENSGYVTDPFLTGLAKAAGVQDINKWNESRNSSKWDSVIANGTNQADFLGFNGTPSILVQGPEGQMPLAGFQLSEIRAAIQRVG